MALSNGITIGQYVPSDSFLHRLDPRCKILLVALTILALFMTDGFIGLAMWAFMLTAAIKISKVPGRVVLRSARPILILVLITVFLHIFGSKGEHILFTVGPLTATKEGLAAALKIGGRLYLLVLYAGMLTLTTSTTELSDGIESIMSPLRRFGFPAHEVAMMMTIALRFIPELFNETDRIISAQISRGANFDTGGPLKRAKAYIPVLIPLFVIVFQKADRLASAMEARCYRGGRGRVRMNPLSWRVRESAVLLIYLAYVGILFLVSGAAC